MAPPQQSQQFRTTAEPQSAQQRIAEQVIDVPNETESVEQADREPLDATQRVVQAKVALEGEWCEPCDSSWKESGSKRRPKSDYSVEMSSFMLLSPSVFLSSRAFGMFAFLSPPSVIFFILSVSVIDGDCLRDNCVLIFFCGCQ